MDSVLACQCYCPGDWLVLTKARTIQTYGNRGVAKPGTTKCYHSIIHTSSAPPAPKSNEAPDVASGERPMLNPIRVRPRKRTDKMDPMSRLNYSKMYTVEHNVKVYDFGTVHENFLHVFKKQFAWAWQFEPESSDDDDEDDDDDDEDGGGGGGDGQANTTIPQENQNDDRQRRESSSKGKKPKGGSSFFGLSSGKEPRKRRSKK
jgi:hypothetical protein